MTALEPFFLAELLGTATWLWLVFISIVMGLLAFDLAVLHREHREIGVSESLLLSAGYITAGLLFGLWVWQVKGGDAGMDFYTGFLIEKSLSMDNVFLMAMIFSFLSIPRRYQHEVLFWGILGVIVLRAIMIGLGAALIAEFSWILYVFGIFLLLTGVKMLFSKVIGGKIFLVGIIGKIPAVISLSVTLGLLLGGVLLSLWKTRDQASAGSQE
ncbi:TerC family protein [Pseudomonas mohnii]